MNQEKKLKKSQWDELYFDLEMQLLTTSSRHEEPLKRSITASLLIRTALQDLKSLIIHQGFDDPCEEIHFFKYTKPRFYSLLLLESKLAQLESNKPVGDKEIINAFYREELALIDRFIKQHAYHYTYYLMDASELDSLYFLRGKEVKNPPVLVIPDNDPNFTTACDFLFAQFMALEMLGTICFF